MEETSELSEACGPHCGVITTGKTKHVGHCQCTELCHGRYTLKDAHRLRGFVKREESGDDYTP